MTALSPLQAIHRHCVECSNGQPAQVSLCQISECPLYHYRNGRNPFTRAETRPEPSETKVLPRRASE